jgi:nucleotide-binding universal stress UspA family protein
MSGAPNALADTARANSAEEIPMFKKIMVCSDLTDASLPALKTAVDLARRLDATLVAVHALEAPYETPQWFVPLEVFEHDLFRSVSARIEEAAHEALAAQLRTAGAQPDCPRLIKRGIATDTIVATAVDLGVDLVVVGSHGRTGLRHVMLGSIAERIARTAPAPVLIVRASEQR